MAETDGRDRPESSIRERLDEHLAHEREIARLARRFLSLGADRIDAGIRESLDIVGGLADADRCLLLSFDPASPDGIAVHQWSGRSVEPHRAKVRDPSSVRFSWSHEQLARGEVIHVPDVPGLPDAAAAERDELVQRGVESLVGIPLRDADRLVGYLGFETIGRRKEWSAESLVLLQLVGEILMGVLLRQRAEVELAESRRQLFQSQKMEAVGTLAGGIAHDFNNHLTVMIGNARYVQSRLADDDRLWTSMEDLVASAEHCAQLTRSMLAFSRLSSVSPTPLDVAAVIASTVEMIEPLIPGSVRFEASPGCDVPEAHADPVQLQQVLVNLVLNARDAVGSDGSIRISSRRRAVDLQEAFQLGLGGPGEFVEVVVCDDGRGMDPGTQQRVFDPFFTTKPMGQGLGLGLATAYGIVRGCGGAIELESAVGRGTTVRVVLPPATAVRAVKARSRPGSASSMPDR